MKKRFRENLPLVSDFPAPEPKHVVQKGSPKHRRMSLGAAECVASTCASQLGGGLRGTGVPRSVRPSHTSMTPNGQSRMCWRSPKIQTHVLTITKNTNQSVCYNAVTALTERFCQNVVGHPPGLRPPDNF